MLRKRVILLKGISSSQADTESVMRAAASHFQFDATRKKIAAERGEESPMGGPE